MFTYFFAKKDKNQTNSLVTALVVKDNAITTYVKTYEDDLETKLDNRKIKSCIQEHNDRNRKYINPNSDAEHKKYHSHSSLEEYEQERIFQHYHLFYKYSVTPEQFYNFLENLQYCSATIFGKYPFISDTEKKQVQVKFEDYFKKPARDYRSSNSKVYKLFGMPSLSEHMRCIEGGFSECPPPTAVIFGTMIVSSVLLVYSVFTCCRRKNKTSKDNTPSLGHLKKIR